MGFGPKSEGGTKTRPNGNCPRSFLWSCPPYPNKNTGPSDSRGNSMLPEEEPICVLKIERDISNIDEILVYENDEPEDIVEEYGRKFKLTENAKKRLLRNVNE